MSGLTLYKAQPRKKRWEKTSSLPSALWWVEQVPGLLLGRGNTEGTLRSYSSLFPNGNWKVEAWTIEWRPREWEPGQEFDRGQLDKAIQVEKQLRGQEFATRSEALQAIQLVLDLL